MDLRLKGKVALVTGGSKGIGLRTALCLAEEGCHVAIVARGAEELEVAAAQIKAHGVPVAAIQADLTQAADAAKAIAACVDQLGALDILVNNVGGNIGARKFMDSSDEDWLQTFDLNVHVAVRITRLAVPYMGGRSGAAVVHISSFSGWRLAFRPDVGLHSVSHWTFTTDSLFALSNCIFYNFQRHKWIFVCLT